MQTVPCRESAKVRLEIKLLDPALQIILRNTVSTALKIMQPLKPETEKLRKEHDLADHRPELPQ